MKQNNLVDSRWNKFIFIKVKADGKKCKAIGKYEGKEVEIEESGESNLEAFKKVMKRLAKELN